MPTTFYVDCSISDRWQYKTADGGQPDPRLQPHLTRLTWIVDDGVSDPLDEKCHLIEIPAVMGGGGRISLAGAMGEFVNDLGTAQRIVTYGWTHHRLVLEHSIEYRLGWAKRDWPDPGDAMVAAVKLAQHDEAVRGATNHMTAGTQRRRGNQFLSFEAAAAARGLTLNQALDPVLAGYQRVWAVRAIWTAYEELDDAAAPEH